MAINPYEPELAKRKKAFEIAYAQLSKHMHKLRNHGAEFRQQMEAADEALKDYRATGYALAEWIERKPEG
ncbi:hypothetical protein [cf. Phormidesmis sp. LEGE 11477]|uniref:hypothetical protein n=1 Tax=cf. Phormidesmis sp. LEGE 11477 TaxID=1828680 RepID=UPI001881FC51|nr:hypothetical protein [cf. Phormidesmis sp. LEGE 11477]